jgi:hypothetical protein
MTAFARWGTAEACTFIEFFGVIFIILTASLPSRTARDGIHNRKVSVVWIVEIPIRVGIDGSRWRWCRSWKVGRVEQARDICHLWLAIIGEVALGR